MQKLFLQFFTLSLVILLFSACSNKIELLDNWKETTVVYGLLNQTDTIQYIKVNKAYLGEGNALKMAQNFDSVNYANELNVKLEQWINGVLVNTLTLTRDSSIVKDAGVFSYPKQIIYTTNQLLSDNSEYQLVVRNTRTGNTIKGKTKLVKKFTINNPTGNSAVGLTNTIAPYRVKWTSSENGKQYQLVIRFNYDELDYTTGVTVAKYVDWVFPAQKSQNTAGGENMEIEFLGSTFYQFLKGVLTVNSNLKRTPKTLDFNFSVAAEDFNTYMEVYQPSYGIVQEKPVYTNIENGIGLFSSRLNQSILGRKLSPLSLDSLVEGQYTGNLGFVLP